MEAAFLSFSVHRQIDDLSLWVEMCGAQGGSTPGDAFHGHKPAAEITVVQCATHHKDRHLQQRMALSVRNPALRGGVLALAAATLFGLSTPLVQRFGLGLGAFTTAALLYGGAALLGVLWRQSPEREARVQRRDMGRLCAMAVFGAVIGPVALAWGLQRTSATSASLLLTLEAMFTAVLAWLLYRESMDRRVVSAVLLLLIGGVCLVLDRGTGGVTPGMGLLAVFLATAAWGVDNTLSRGLADRDPSQVVWMKSALGAGLSTLCAFGMGESLPGWVSACALLLVGATGYGLSLRLYLLAQRAFGAARTGSVFAFAPFIGALAAVAAGDRSGGGLMWLGAALMLGGVALHLMESHDHEHEHEALEHEHAHRHDDGHHDHAHDPLPVGSHSHLHRHPSMRHQHSHVPDAHHGHVHP